MSCPEKNKENQLDTILKNIPVLRFLKEPAASIDNLYLRYPDGGQWGWFAFVKKDNTFAYWEPQSNKWELLASEKLQSILNIDQDELQDGDTPIWDADSQKFTIVNLNIIGTEEY